MIVVSTEKARKWRRARYKEERAWKAKNGPLTVYKLDQPAVILHQKPLPPQEIAPHCACGLRIKRSGTKRGKRWSGWFCKYQVCIPLWERVNE